MDVAILSCDDSDDEDAWEREPDWSAQYYHEDNDWDLQEEMFKEYIEEKCGGEL
jgi:hypothetical protein